MSHRSVLAITVIVCITCASSAQGQTTPPVQSPPATPAGPPAATPAPAVSSDGDDPQRAYDAGKEYAARGDFDLAIPQLLLAYQQRADALILLMIAEAYRQSQRPQQALEYYQRYLKQEPAAQDRPEVAARITELSTQLGVPIEIPPPPPPDARALAQQGRQLLKARDIPGAVAKLKEATAKGNAEKLDSEAQATLHYIYGFVLLSAEKEGEALQQFERAVALSPNDPTLRVTLASQYLAVDKLTQARVEAEIALKLGITDKDDLETARTVVKDAKRQLLQERLTVNAMVSWAYDSNVLQGGPIIQIANKSTNNRRASAALAALIHNRVAPAMLKANLTTFLVNTYNTPSPSTQEWDLPLNIDIPIDGRLFSGSGVELWLGYRFQQTLMLSPIGYDHDDYNLQEHDLPLRLDLTPTKWLFLRGKAEGFVNFSGLRQFAPYQGGLNSGFEAWFIESPRWKTRVLYQHQLRRSFDQGNNGYLNGDRDEVKLVQELRLRGHGVKVRGSLGGRFRSDRTGVFSTTQDYDLASLRQVATPASSSCDGLAGAAPVLMKEARLGCYTYSAPLSYDSVELSTRWLVSVPHGVNLAMNLSYEYFYYPALYTASFVPTLSPADNADPGTWQAAPAGTSSITMPSARRIDNLFTLYVGVTKRLPHDFSLELSYAFYKNFSTIANYIDNRSYDKNVVQLAAYYTF